jgi:hypothetical protein
MRRSRLWTLAFAALAALSCADAGSEPESSPPIETASHDSSAFGIADGTVVNRLPIVPTLLSCEVLPLQQSAQVIGPDGGTITVGPHRLVVPRGALATDVPITAEITGDAASTVRFSPEGLQFQRPATLTLSYQHCPVVRSLLPKRIVYTTDDLRILELLRSIDFLWRKQVSAPIDHFSKYAVAY